MWVLVNQASSRLASIAAAKRTRLCFAVSLQKRKMDKAPVIPKPFILQHLPEIERLQHSDELQIDVELVQLGPGELDISSSATNRQNCSRMRGMVGWWIQVVVIKLLGGVHCYCSTGLLMVTMLHFAKSAWGPNTTNLCQDLRLTGCGFLICAAEPVICTSMHGRRHSGFFVFASICFT